MLILRFFSNAWNLIRIRMNKFETCSTDHDRNSNVRKHSPGTDIAPVESFNGYFHDKFHFIILHYCITSKR